MSDDASKSPARDSPIERWCQWAASLPPDVADELAGMIAAMLPGAPLVLDSKPASTLIAQIRATRAPPRREAGLALCLAALTDVITQAQADPETWAETNAMLDVLDQAAGDVLGADVGEFVARAKLRTPLVSRQWKVVAASWSTLRADTLSPKTISSWLRRKRSDSLRPV